MEACVQTCVCVCRVCVDSIHVEFQSLARRVDHLKQQIHTDVELLVQLQTLLKVTSDLWPFTCLSVTLASDLKYICIPLSHCFRALLKLWRIWGSGLMSFRGKETLWSISSAKTKTSSNWTSAYEFSRISAPNLKKQFR